MTDREGATVRTSDGVEITHDLRVWTNDFRRGSVVIEDRNRPHQEAGEWWFSVLEDGARPPHLVVGVAGHDERPPPAARSTSQLHEVGPDHPAGTAGAGRHGVLRRHEGLLGVSHPAAHRR